MILGIVSDTHGKTELARPAVKILKSHGVELVIHCGDVGSAEIVELLRPWPTHFVFGNTDVELDELRQAMGAAGHVCHERFGSIEQDGRRIAFLHGDDSRRLRETIERGDYDLVCYGHTHVPEQHRSGNTLVLNPGALYRAQRHTLAIVKLPELSVTHVTV